MPEHHKSSFFGDLTLTPDDIYARRAGGTTPIRRAANGSRKSAKPTVKGRKTITVGYEILPRARRIARR